jgi:hypothetical protein
MTDWGQHPFLDPHQRHTYDGMPPTVFASPNDFAYEHDWYASNELLRIQMAEYGRYGAWTTDYDDIDDDPISPKKDNTATHLLLLLS